MSSNSTQHVAAEWYLLQFRPNCLSLALRNLMRQGVETFCPMLAETKKVRGQFRQMKCPLFPGYLFARFDPRGLGWRSIKGTRGVSKIVSFGDVPRPVPSALVDGLRLRSDTEGVLLPPNDLRPGDEVRVTAGPFVDFVCSIESSDKDRRIWALLDIMGRETRVKFRPEDVQKVF